MGTETKKGTTEMDSQTATKVFEILMKYSDEAQELNQDATETEEEINFNYPQKEPATNI